MAVDIRDWFGSPREWGPFGTKVNYWLNQIVDELRSVRTAVTTAQAEVDALEVATAGLGDGTASITFPTNIDNFGAGYEPLSVFVTRDGIVYLYGLISNNTGGAVADGGVVATLPIGWRPPAIAFGVCLRTAGSARVDIETDGEIRIKQFAWPNADFLWISATYKLT